MSSDVTYEQIALTFPLCMALAFRSEFFHQSIMPFVIGLYILNRNTFYLTDHKYTRGMLLRHLFQHQRWMYFKNARSSDIGERAV